MTCNPANASCVNRPVTTERTQTTLWQPPALDPLNTPLIALPSLVPAAPRFDLSLFDAAPAQPQMAIREPVVRAPAPSAPRISCSVPLARRYDIAHIRSMPANVQAALGFDPRNAASVRELQQLLHVRQTGRMDAATTSALNRAVRAIQTTLADNGVCAVGAVDGIMGPHTAAAMASFFGAGHSVMSILRQLR